MPKNTKRSGKTLTKAKPHKAPSTKAYRTTETIGGHEFDLTYFEPMHPFDLDRLTGVKIIAFNDENEILAIRKQEQFDPSQKLDIISDVSEKDDKNYEATIRRAAREEANVELGRLHLAAVIERRFKGASSDSASYIIVMTARITKIVPYVEYQEPNERFFLTKQDFLKRYNAGKAEDLSKLIDMAEFVIDDATNAAKGYDPIIAHIMKCC